MERIGFGLLLALSFAIKPALADSGQPPAGQPPVPQLSARWDGNRLVVPLVKRGIYSGSLSNDQDELIGFFLDAINNHGFSGGPVVTGGAPAQIVGVVHGYLNDVPSEVVGPNSAHLLDQAGKPLGLSVIGNSGLLVAYKIEFALDLIHKHPIGPLVKPQPSAQK